MKILTFTVLYFLSQELSFARKNDMTFHYLTADDGLSQNKVCCVLRDSKNYVWFGTEDGLDRYDGSQLEVYKNDPKNPKSICGNRIVCIAEDTEKNIWVGSYDGLSLYIPDDDSFISFRNDPSDRNSISSNIIDCIFADTKQNLWIGVDGKEGLNKWNPDSKTFTRYQVVDSERKVQTNTITDIVQDKKGNIWLASSAYNGIIRFEPDKTKFTFYNDASIPISKEEKLLFVDNDNIIWISTFGAGLFSFDPSNNTFKKYNSLGDGKGTNGKVIGNIIQEDNNNLLIAVDQGGINRFNKQTKSFEYISYKPNNPNGLNNNGIWHLYKDKEGILWVGTSGGGVNICNPKSEKFKLLRNVPGEPNSLSNDIICSIYEDSKGLIWINTDGGGISVYDPLTGNFKNYKNNPKDPFSLQCNVIRHTVEDKNHDYWSGTWDGGLIKLNHRTGKFTQYLPESNKPYNISGRNVWYNVVDNNGIMWLSIYKVGIDLLDPKRGIIQRFRSNPDLKGTLRNDVIHFMYEDSHSNMWLCTSDELSLFDSITKSFKVYEIFPPREAIKSFIEDKEGCYWAGASNTGLVRFKLDGTVLKTYNTSNGLPNNTVNGILEDNNNNIWISTNDGISRINYKTGKIRNYSKSDGLQGNQFFQQSCLKTKSGEMYFGGFNGLNSFFPDKMQDNTYIPQVYINEFQLFNKPVPVGQPNSPLQKVIEQTKEIILSWKQTVFSFGFTAINYMHPEKNLYAYKMEGFDKDWNYTDANHRSATYTNLDAGEYTFRVKASNNDGIWNDSGTSIRIIILPPWWETWWFKTIVGLAILCIAFGFYFYRINQLKRQKKYLEGIVELRTREVNEKNLELLEHTEELGLMNSTLIENQQRIERQAIELNNSLALTKATLESIHDGILAVNDQGVVVKTNAKFAEMWNIPDDIIASGDDKILMDSVFGQLNDVDEFIATVMELYRTPEAESFDLIDFKDGRTFERVSMPMYIGSKPKGRVWSFLDITNRKQAEAEIKLKNEQLLELNAAKDKFFSIIAHDLRSPFNGFLGLTQIMAEELSDLTMEEIKNIAVSMKNSATNLFQLLENLLEWAKIQQGLIPFNPKLIQLLSVVDECIVIMQEPAKTKGIEITYVIPDNLKVFADSNILQTVIRNLVSNALKFTPKGGKVSLSAKDTGNKSVEISIRDTGIGMGQKMIDNLFGIGVQTNRKGTEGEPSSGLGLLLCKEFVEKHGGKLWVESEEGKGSVFYFTIPWNSKPEEKIVTKNITPAEGA